VRTMTDSDEEEYCAKCGDSEFDDKGNETHADEDEYDHDFVYEDKDEEAEDDEITLDDVKKVADTASSVFKAVKAFKDVTDDSKSEKGHHETSTPWPPASDQKKPGTWGRYVLRLRKPKSEVAKSQVEKKLDRIEGKIDHGTKRQNRKWYIGIGIAVLLTIIGLLLV